MFGGKPNGTATVPTGLALLAKSMGIDPQMIISQIDALKTQGLDMAQQFVAHLAALEAQTRANMEAQKTNAETLARIEGKLDAWMTQPKTQQP